MRKLDHPSVMKIYETFEDDKNVFLVLDYCEGGELFDRLDEHGNFGEDEARTIFTQMIKVIKYLHSQKICHRDLKPENFLMSSKTSLDLKLIDFGLSYEWRTNMHDDLVEDKKNKLVGTSYYIAPEVLALNYDEKCDIWSSGVLLYILVTAAPPFDGEDDKKIMESVKKLNYTFNIPEAKDLSDEVKDLIKKILVPANERISIDDILAHPWMNKKGSEHKLKVNFSRIRSFANFSKLKSITVEYIASQLPEKEIHELGEIFKQIDKNCDGFLTVDELKQALESQNEKLNVQELKDIISFIDMDKNGMINYNEFVASCLENSFIENEKYLEYVFRSFDKDGSGKISRKELAAVLADSSKGIPTDLIEELIKETDKDLDGEINYL